MVKEAKFFRKQAIKAETAARAAFDAEISEGLFAMAIAYRNQAALLKKKQKAGPKKNKALKKADAEKKNDKKKHTRRTAKRRRRS